MSKFKFKKSIDYCQLAEIIINAPMEYLKDEDTLANYLKTEEKSFLSRNDSEKGVRITDPHFSYVLFSSGYTARIAKKLLDSDEYKVVDRKKDEVVKKFGFEGDATKQLWETSVLVSSKLGCADYEDSELGGLLGDVTDSFHDNCCCTIDKVYEPELLDFLRNMICIYDRLHGDGLYTFKFADRPNRKPSETLGWVKKFYGSILFRCESFRECMQYYNILKAMNYCSMHSMEHLKIINLENGVNIAYINIDAESG